MRAAARRWFLRGIGLVLAPLLALALAEAVVRATETAPPAEMPSPLPFQGAPLAFAPAGPELYVVPAQHPLLATRKKVGKRVFVVGSSAAAGDGHHPYLSFASRLETYLWRIDPESNWEVMTLAQGGTSARHQLGQVEAAVGDGDADVVVVYSGNNELHEIRALKRVWPAFSPHALLLRYQLSQLHLYRFLRDRLTPLPTPPENIGQNWPPLSSLSTVADDDDRRLSRVLYRDALSRMVAVARAAGSPVVLSTVATNLRDFVDQEAPALTPAANVALEAVSEALRRGDVAAALTAAEGEALQGERGQHALGGRFLAAGDRADALYFFENAEARALRPVRSDRTLRRIVGEVAEAEEAGFCDTAAAMRAAARDGIPGKELFGDACHPNATGHRVLAQALASCLVEGGLVEARGVALKEAFAEDLPSDGWRLDLYREDVLAEQPAMVLALRGHEAVRQGRYAAAAAAYREAMAAGGPEGPLLLSLGLALVHQGDAAGARNALDAAVAALPGDEAAARYRALLQ